jgi:hypothetical protein
MKKSIGMSRRMNRDWVRKIVSSRTIAAASSAPTTV